MAGIPCPFLYLVYFMTKTQMWKLILTLGLVLTLFTVGVSADAEYDFDTKNLFVEDETYFIAGGADLILPVNLTCSGDGELVSRIEVTATVLDGQNPVNGLTYTYSSPLEEAIYGQKHSTPNVFAMSGMGTNAVGIHAASPIFELNISGLSAGKTYTVNLAISSGNGTQADVTSEKSIAVEVKGNWLRLEKIDDNTVPGYDESKNWSFTRNAKVSTVVLSLPSPAMTGTYNSSIPFPKISGTSTTDYPFAITLNRDNATISVNASVDGTSWTPVTADVKENTDGTVQVGLTNPQADTKYLQITFIGKKLGDVIDLGSDTVDLADVDNLLQEIAHKKGNNVAKNRYIYGDVKRDGNIDISDALLIFQHYMS